MHDSVVVGCLLDVELTVDVLGTTTQQQATPPAANNKQRAMQLLANSLNWILLVAD